MNVKQVQGQGHGSWDGQGDMITVVFSGLGLGESSIFHYGESKGHGEDWHTNRL